MFLLAKDLRRFLLIMITRSFFFFSVSRGYIRKVSVHLVQKYFPHYCITDSVFLVANGKKECDGKISKLDSNKTDTRQCYC